MAKRPKTGFDKYFDSKMADPKFAAGYQRARAEIDTVDRIIRQLNEARLADQVSKAELARRIGARPEILRRLFTAKDANPTLSTLAKLADALGYELTLVPTRKPAKRARSAGRHVAAAG